MKILHVIDSCGFYGAEAVLLELMSEQKAQGCQPVLLSLGAVGEGEKAIERMARSCGVELVVIRASSLAALIRSVYRACRENDFWAADVVHSHGYKGNILFGLFLKPLCKIPLVSTLHGWTSTQRFSKLRVYELFDQLSLRRFDARVAVTAHHPALSSFLLRNKNNNKVVHNGIRPLTFETDTVERQDKDFADFCRDGFIVGGVGRLSPEKGFENLIRALTLLPDQFKLVIIGEGDCRDDLTAAMTELGVNHRVLLPGYRDRAFNYIKYFDVFVLPSLTEGLPMIILEAMQAQCPIIATDVGGVADTLRDGSYGHVIPPENPEAIAGRIKHVHDHRSEAMAMTRAAYHHVINHYSCAKMAQGYRKIYDCFFQEIRDD